MSDRAIHENGISIKLCELCNSNKEFLTKFLRLFDNIPKQDDNKTPKDVDYIYFSGNHETGNGKPDITVRFEDGSYFYIEVKTNAKTEFQSSQLEGYKELINKKGQDVENSFAFLLDRTHVNEYKTSHMEEIQDKLNDFHFVTWNEVLNLIESEIKYLDFKKRLEFFKDDLKKNVDGLNECPNNVFLTREEYKTITDPNELMKYEGYLNRLQKLNLNGNDFLFIPKELNTEKSKNFMSKKLIKFNLGTSFTNYWLPDFGYYVSFEYECNKPINDSIFIGFNISILSDNNFIAITNDEIDKKDYFFSISIKSDLLNITKIKDDNSSSDNVMMRNSENYVRFCKSKDNWYYFPLKDLSKEKESFDINKLPDFFKNEIRDKLKYIFRHYLPDNISCL